MKKKAIVAGHICLDITPLFGQKKAERVSEILQPGKLVEVGAADVHTGGAVANTGLGMKKLGADVRLLAKVGNDAFGTMVQKILNQYGAGDDLIVSDEDSTSYSVVLAIPGIDRMFLHNAGANNTFSEEDIPDSALDGVSLFHFGYPPLMQRMYEDDGEHLVNLMRRVKNRGIATSLDLAAVDPQSRAGQCDWEKILERTLPYIDFFVPSFEELCFMLDRSKYDQLVEAHEGDDITKHLSLEDDIRPLADKCLKLGAKAVLLKCGAPGMYLKTSDKMQETGERLALDAEKWNLFEAFEPSFQIDHVLSGTGAGDTSIAAFLTSILEGYGPKESLENASATGALCCTAVDAVSGLLPLREVRKKIDGGWEKSYPIV